MKIEEKIYKIVLLEELNKCLRDFLRRQGCAKWEEYQAEKYEHLLKNTDYDIFVSSNINIFDKEDLINGKFTDASAELILNWMADEQEIIGGNYILRR